MSLFGLDIDSFGLQNHYANQYEALRAAQQQAASNFYGYNLRERIYRDQHTGHLEAPIAVNHDETPNPKLLLLEDI